MIPSIFDQRVLDSSTRESYYQLFHRYIKALEQKNYVKKPIFIARDTCNTHGLRNELTNSNSIEKDVSLKGKKQHCSQQGDVHDKYRQFLGQNPSFC